MQSLTFDKPHLSGPKNSHSGTAGGSGALECTNKYGARALECIDQIELRSQPEIEDFVRQSLSENTRRAYSSDLARFEAWGGAVPASREIIAAYLTEHAATHATTTLVRWLASLSKAHRAMQSKDPTKDELVRSVLRGVRRRYGRPPKQAAPLTREILFETLDAIPADLRGLRDKALLLVGFAGGFRRSELVNLEIPDIANKEEGLVLTIRRSKTDQSGQGRKIGIPYARGRHCPVKGLRAWTDTATITKGRVFRPIDRHGTISDMGLSGQAVSLMIKERMSGASLDPTGFSGHSLRSGFVTSAAKAGISSWKIRQQTGHASDTMLARYIRDSEIFVNNAAGTLL